MNTLVIRALTVSAVAAASLVAVLAAEALVPGRDHLGSPVIRARVAADFNAVAVAEATPRPELRAALSRGTKGDKLQVARRCSGQVWPYIARECLAGPSRTAQTVRVITVEQRTGQAFSALRRLPLTEIAER
jgi:hypothetical protein